MAGIVGGLNGRLQIPRKDKDNLYKEIVISLQKGVSQQVKTASQKLAAVLKDKNVVKTTDGIHYVRLRKGQIITDPGLSLRESIAENSKMISQIAQLTVSTEDDMPAVIRETLPLLGKGAEVQAWALAKAVYEGNPLPSGITPYTILR